jgi:hypothetical protein
MFIRLTIGLLIALSLEGLVEWQHHRHLVHEAEASLYAEIKSNESGLASVLTDLRKQQATLKQVGHPGFHYAEEASTESTPLQIPNNSKSHSLRPRSCNKGCWILIANRGPWPCVIHRC